MIQTSPVLNKKPAWDIHGGLKSGDLDDEWLRFSSERTRPATDTLIVRHFSHLGCERGVYAHVISFSISLLSSSYNSE
jgi:hypothetical protein